MTDIIRKLDELVDHKDPVARAVAQEAAEEIRQLRKQRDELQRRGTELVEENRRLRAEVAELKSKVVA